MQRVFIPTYRRSREHALWLTVKVGDVLKCMLYNRKGRQKKKYGGQIKKKKDTLIYTVPYFYPDIFVSLVVYVLD